MREAHLVPESEMSSEELVKRCLLAQAAEAPPLPPARRLRRQQRMLARMAHYVPSARNRRIFEEVEIHHKTQEAVAFSERLSRQRVAKILQRMRDWIAYWGGDDAAYGPEQRSRLATHVAMRELIEFQGQIQQALARADDLIDGARHRFNGQGEKQSSDMSYQRYPRPTSLYKMLLTAILARARLAGAGRDAGPELGGAGSQSMVVNTEINVNQAALQSPSQSPSKGALRSDVLSAATSVAADGHAAAAIDAAAAS